MVKVGASKVDITRVIPGIGMLGWGRFDHRVEEVESNLYARAFFLENSDHRQIIVVAEICFITISLRQGVMELLEKNHAELNIREHELFLTATHTHSAPGGYSHYVFYNLMVPGYSPEIYQTYVEGIVRAIVEAYHRREPATIRRAAGDFPLNIPVAFNRSISSWNLNVDTPKYSHWDRNKATNRTMTLMRFDSVQGKPLGQINWFACHSTSVHGDNSRISSDNKGYAAREFEKVLMEKNQQFVAAFAQGAPGDVSPNFSWHRGFRDLRGRFKNDYRNAKHNGTFQLKQAQFLYGEALNSAPEPEKLGSVFSYADLSLVEVDPQFSQGQSGQRTGSAAIGTRFLIGTEEGRGIPEFLLPALNALEIVRAFFVSLWFRLLDPRHRLFLRDDPIQGRKVVFIETGINRILGTSNFTKLVVPRWAHPAINELKKQYEAGAMNTQPMTPQVLPIQLVRIGNFGIAAMPSELTTQAANRLKRMCEEELKIEGIDAVQVCSYSNGYAGYCTTYEEYQNQRYEGASTHFGKWTLAAYQTLYQRLCRVLLRSESPTVLYPDLKPHRFSDQELSNRLFIR